MNKILHNFGFGAILKGKESNPKRTKESVLGFRHDGCLMQVEYCLPKDREAMVKYMFDTYPKVTLINVKPLRGKTVVIKREELQKEKSFKEYADDVEKFNRSIGIGTGKSNFIK